MRPSEILAAEYAVRRFEPGDRAGFLSLYEDVFGRERGPRWFDWKFEANPYADHVPVVVAVRDGEVVGARSFFPLEVRLGAQRRIAYQPCDTMVRRDHRERGLCTRMNELALDRYADGGPSFFFNFPNAYSTPINVKHGWRPVGTVPMYYRPQSPVGALRQFLGDEHETAVPRTAERALAAAVAGVDRLRDRLASRSAADVRVDRYETPPAARLEAAYRRAIPDRIHGSRTATYYRWRLANPVRSYVTYVATRDGETVAALIASPVDDQLRIVDALPRAVTAERGAIERLLDEALADHADYPVVTAFGRTLPAPTRYLFVPDTRPPFSSLLRPTARTLFARDLDADLAVERSSIADWSLSRLDLDTS